MEEDGVLWTTWRVRRSSVAMPGEDVGRNSRRFWFIPYNALDHTADQYHRAHNSRKVWVGRPQRTWTQHTAADHSPQRYWKTQARGVELVTRQVSCSPQGKQGCSQECRAQFKSGECKTNQVTSKPTWFLARKEHVSDQPSGALVIPGRDHGKEPSGWRSSLTLAQARSGQWGNETQAQAESRRPGQGPVDSRQTGNPARSYTDCSLTLKRLPQFESVPTNSFPVL